MKIIAFVAVALLASFGSASPVNEYLETELDIEARGIIDNTINSTLNNIIGNLSETIDVSSVPIDLGTNEILSGQLNLADLTISGLKSLVATKISVNVLTMKIVMELKLTELLVKLNYDADMLLLQLVPLYGDGVVSLNLDEVVLDINAKANVTDGVSIQELALGLTLGDAVFDVTGLINSPELSSIVSNALNDNFAKFINDNQEVITEVISPLIKDLLNDLLSESSMYELEGLNQLIYEY